MTDDLSVRDGQTQSSDGSGPLSALLRMAGALPCDPRHRGLLEDAAKAVDQLDRLRADKQFELIAVGDLLGKPLASDLEIAAELLENAALYLRDSKPTPGAAAWRAADALHLMRGKGELPGIDYRTDRGAVLAPAPTSPAENEPPPATPRGWIKALELLIDEACQHRGGRNLQEIADAEVLLRRVLTGAPARSAKDEAQTLRTNRDGDLRESVRKTAAEVDTWPEWKRNALGNSASVDGQEATDMHRLFGACIAAYRKHVLRHDSIGWDELSQCLSDALWNALGGEPEVRAAVAAQTQAQVEKIGVSGHDA